MKKTRKNIPRQGVELHHGPIREQDLDRDHVKVQDQDLVEVQDQDHVEVQDRDHVEVQDLTPEEDHVQENEQIQENGHRQEEDPDRENDQHQKKEVAQNLVTAFVLVHETHTATDHMRIKNTTRQNIPKNDANSTKKYPNWLEKLVHLLIDHNLYICM